jgi:hypothetical protein
MGDCLLWAIWAKITEVAHIIGLLFHTAKVMHDFFQKLGYILGDFFTNASGHPGFERVEKKRNLSG